MGYTTTFDGQFELSRQLTEAEAIQFEHAEFENGPNEYCQWVVSEDRKHIRWDYEEKFYNYVEWLRVLVDSFFKPRRIGISGEVTWQGEEQNDRGRLLVINGEVYAMSVEDSPYKHCGGSGISPSEIEIQKTFENRR